MQQCAICGKGPVIGSRVTHRGKLKKEGGVGRRTVRVNRRRFLPNLQRAT
ncbi:MAG: 50S ribosomal protein L28, partial [Candidatus Omnitrophica bacterium]|nr:50S ribosomal protein L28 [Candidatus Omnitrophota bacterium]